MKVGRRDKHALWQLQHVLNETYLKIMRMTPFILTFVVSVSALPGDVGIGREWLQCSWSQWIQKYCVDDEDIEDSGRLCPLC